MKQLWQKVSVFFRQETVLCVAGLCAVVTAFFCAAVVTLSGVSGFSGLVPAFLSDGGGIRSGTGWAV